MCHERKAACSESKNNINFENIKELLDCALKKFYKDDKELFEYAKSSVSERCMVFRIALYILEEIKGNEKLKLTDFDLDCEYNRHNENVKKINKINVTPDLLIHCRKTDTNNLLVVEFKKGRAYPNNEKQPYKKHIDVKKLIAFTSPRKSNIENCYGYKFGMYIELHADKVKVELYENGKITKRYEWTSSSKFKILAE